MASLIRVGFTKLTNSNTCRFILTPKNIENIGVRCISSKVIRDLEKRAKPFPWDYKNKRYNLFHFLYDRTTARIDENSKIIVVEGPPAAGKSKVAKALAENLDMLYMPEANLDMIYINEAGYDLKQLDEQLPESCRSFDINNFLLNPKHRLTASFQIKQYSIKYSQYIDALAHVLSTGQGVVLDRSCYSDFVFLEAMFKQNYITKPCRDAYYDVRKNTINELLRPHLILYLDVPVKKVIENIKARNLPYEVNSPAINEKYLGEIEKQYKQEFLQTMSKHSELLVYDWSEAGDVDVVVEDIERIDFDKYAKDPHDTHMKDWDFSAEEEWAWMRHNFSDNKTFLMTYLNCPHYECPEFIIEAEDFHKSNLILDEAPGERFRKGYDKALGDEGTLFKVGLPFRDTLPLRERRNFTASS